MNSLYMRSVVSLRRSVAAGVMVAATGCGPGGGGLTSSEPILSAVIEFKSTPVDVTSVMPLQATYSAADVLAALKTASGRNGLGDTAPSSSRFEVLDVDGDGAISHFDARSVLNLAASRVSPGSVDARFAKHHFIVSLIYVSLFGRPSRPDELNAWASHLEAHRAPDSLQGFIRAYDSNVGVRQMIDGIGSSPEALRLFGSNPGFAVSEVYRNLFNRSGEPERSDQYAREILSGRLAPAKLGLLLIAEATGDDTRTATRKTEVALAFTSSLDSIGSRNYRSAEVFTSVRAPLRSIDAFSPDAGAVSAIEGSMAGELHFQTARAGRTPLDYWPESQRQLWTGSQLEAQAEYCGQRSVRWISPIWLDVNRDGVQDFIMPISCYQGEDVAPGLKHNRQVIAAWKIWCSTPSGQYEDCTRERFGSNTINATGSDSGGGNPYVHTMEEPYDINGDGYPDVWYALNRDDGRPGLQYELDANLLEQYCGARQPDDWWEWDCTRKAKQSILLSRSDGTYRVVFLPWAPTNTQAMVMLPNVHGGFDALSFNYGRWRAARLLGDEFVDVTDEYKSYRNIDAVAGDQPYARSFRSEGASFLVKAGQPVEVIDPEIRRLNGSWGFTVWRWIPGAGFELSDTYAPAPVDTFKFKERAGDSFVEAYGAHVRGVAVLRPYWHFFAFGPLERGGGDVLIAFQESGTPAGDGFRKQLDLSKIYSQSNERDTRFLRAELSVVDSFDFRGGKLIRRSKSVIEGDVLWNTARLELRDINGDGLLDAYGMTGHMQGGGLYLNDGQGTLRKLYTRQLITEVSNSDPAYVGPFVWTLRATRPGERLTLVQWGAGFSVLPSWAGSQNAVSDIRILGGGPRASELPVYSPALMQKELQSCLYQALYTGSCPVR